MIFKEPAFYSGNRCFLRLGNPAGRPCYVYGRPAVCTYTWPAARPYVRPAGLGAGLETGLGTSLAACLGAGLGTSVGVSLGTGLEAGLGLYLAQTWGAVTWGAAMLGASRPTPTGAPRLYVMRLHSSQWAIASSLFNVALGAGRIQGHAVGKRWARAVPLHCAPVPARGARLCTAPCLGIPLALTDLTPVL